MTIQAWWLLKKLKKAQTCPDGLLYIDTDKMLALTVCPADQIDKQKKIKLKTYRYSLDATLKYLKGLDYILLADNGEVKATYAGWHAFSATVMGTVKVILLNVIIPIIVSVIAAIVTTLLMTVS